MKTKITPGKWEVTGNIDMLRVEKKRKDGSWALIAEVHTEDHKPPRYEEAEANAKLIAASPLLLKAIKSLYEFASQYGPSSRASAEDWSGHLSEAEKAIKTATT